MTEIPLKSVEMKEGRRSLSVDQTTSALAVTKGKEYADHEREEYGIAV